MIIYRAAAASLMILIDRSVDPELLYVGYMVDAVILLMQEVE